MPQTARSGRHTTWAPEWGNPCPSPRRPATPLSARNEHEALHLHVKAPLVQHVKVPASCPSTGTGSGSSPSEGSGDESGSCSPPLSVVTPDLADGRSTPESPDGRSTPESPGELCGAEAKDALVEAMWSGRAREREGALVGRPCGSSRREDAPRTWRAGPQGEAFQLHEGTECDARVAAHDGIDSCVTAARAAAAKAKKLTTALNAELRDIGIEMEQLTQELLAIQAAVPENSDGKKTTMDWGEYGSMC